MKRIPGQPIAECVSCHKRFRLKKKPSVEERDGTFRVQGDSRSARLATCPMCRSTETSEYMPTRWMCLHCGAKFLLEKAPEIVVQPTKETIIHEGPTDTRELERGVGAISGVKGGVDASKGKVCPRCKSGYINPT